VMDFWREMAKRSGLSGLYLMGFSWHPSWVPQEHGFDASIVQRLPAPMQKVPRRRPIKWLLRQYQLVAGKPTVYSYKKILSKLLEDGPSGNGNYPCVIPNWDNTPRSGRNGLVFHGSTPELFRIHLKEALRAVKDFPPQHRTVFVKSWNEWAEGNDLEPEL
jgi:hypothetical protein